MNPKKDIIIISEGGCMSGVFGAGVFSAFQTFGLEERIDSIYAASAGAANAAFFLGGDTFL
jgi:predicted patatin/cPLA2 family phospholipase